MAPLLHDSWQTEVPREQVNSSKLLHSWLQGRELELFADYLCYHRRGNNDKYHLWWLLMWPDLYSHQVNYCEDTICENIWWDTGSKWPLSRAFQINWKSVLLPNHTPFIDSFFPLHFKTGGKTVRFYQEASKDQSQSLLIFLQKQCLH